MQPAAPNPWNLVMFINLIMTGKATAKEQELQGASSGHTASAALATLMTRANDATDVADDTDTT